MPFDTRTAEAPPTTAFSTLYKTVNGSATPSSSGNMPVVQLVYEDARHSDIPTAAAIATAVFADESREVFTAGPTPEQVAYRTHLFGQSFAGHLAHRQGKRQRPQRFVVARDPQSGRIVGFVLWEAGGGGGGGRTKEEGKAEHPYQATDKAMPDDYAPHAEMPTPPSFSHSARESFVSSSSQCRSDFVGHESHCYIKYLCVDPTVQRTGAGRALMRLTRKENPGRSLYLEAANTPSAVRFYLKMGFEQVGNLTFDGCKTPLPCMRLDPNTVSLIDSEPVVGA